MSNVQQFIYRKSSKSVEFTSGSGTWTVPAGVNVVKVLLVGGGSGANGAVSGAGGATIFMDLAVTPGSSVSYSVGAGGAGSSSAYNVGGNTTFGSLTAYGGGILESGGFAGYSGRTFSLGAGFALGFTGGSGRDTTFSLTDAFGAMGVNTTYPGGGGSWGVGGNAVNSGTGGSAPANSGGGGGATGSGTGGNGGSGYILVTWVG